MEASRCDVATMLATVTLHHSTGAVSSHSNLSATVFSQPNSVPQESCDAEVPALIS